MLAWMTQQKIAGLDGVVAYGDDQSPFVFYLLATQPRFRIGPNGNPVFEFLKYRNPIDRGNGKRGGGFLIFDVVFSVPDATVNAAKAKLQEQISAKFKPAKPQVEIRQISFTRGAASLQLFDSGGANAAMVQRVQNPSQPSLYGDMITPFTLELSPEGATLAESALQGKGGVVQVVYDLYTPVKLPNMKVTVWFKAEKFQSFSQKVDIDKHMWGNDSYRETVNEKLTSTDTGGVDIDPGGVTDAKIVSAARDWGYQSLDDAVKRMLVGDIPEVSTDARKVPDGIRHLTRNFSTDKIASFRRTMTEGVVIEPNIGPRGTLPNITNLNGGDGKPLKWSDYARTVDLDDPFFRQINVNVQANADFVNLPIFSIDGQISYDEGNTHASTSFTLKSPNDIVKFASFIEGNKKNYNYHYSVNYKGESKKFDSGPKTSQGDEPLTIDIGSTGILVLDVLAGDINFDLVGQVLVQVHYEDSASGVAPVDWQVILDKDHRAQNLQKVIFAARTQPFKYKAKYDMKDGKTYVTDWKISPAAQIYVGSPFGANKTVSVRAIGDMQTDIQTIFVDLSYTDDQNHYKQSTSIALDKKSTFFDWTFPVIDESIGTVKYSGAIQFQDGQPQTIPETTATSATIFLGKAHDDSEFLQVSVQPDLLDFSKLKVVKVTLHYTDAKNSIDVSKSLLFTKTTANALAWSLRLIDKANRTYTYTAEYHMLDGQTVTSGPISSSDSILLLDMPAASAAAGTGA